MVRSASTTQDIFSTVSRKDYIGSADPKSIVDFLEFQKSDVSKATGQPKASIRYDERIPAEVRKRIQEIGNIINLVAEYFDGDLEKTKLWFDTPNPLLGDMSPRDMIRYARHLKLRRFVLSALSGKRP